MNRDTGDIIERGPEDAELDRSEYFGIDYVPSDTCLACAGLGYIGAFGNGKVIPCVCVFTEKTRWMQEVAEQRKLKRRHKDVVKEVIKAAKGGA